MFSVAKVIPMPRRHRRKIDSLAVVRAWREHCDERLQSGSTSSLSGTSAGRGGKDDLPRSAKKPNAV
jgi:hypothetical protein